VEAVAVLLFAGANHALKNVKGFTARDEAHDKTKDVYTLFDSVRWTGECCVCLFVCLFGFMFV
jgi:hypothetical protein